MRFHAVQSLEGNIRNKLQHKQSKSARDYGSMEQREHYFIDRLTPNEVKLKLGCIFNKYSKIKS